MFHNAIINQILNHLPRDKWDRFSHLCALFSRPTIGSPIEFTYQDLRLIEYSQRNMPADLKDKFITFCYPDSLPNRIEQLQCDHHYYWKNTTTFIVFNNKNDIAGCVQIIFHDNSTSLPVEYANTTVSSGKYKFDFHEVLPEGDYSISEIYRCRRSFDLKRTQILTVIEMLFKATWIKIQQCRIDYSFISFDPVQRELKNLYMRRFAFEDPEVRLIYSDHPKVWHLLIKNWKTHDKTFASLGKSQFYLQTWIRSNIVKSESTKKSSRTCNVKQSVITTKSPVLTSENVLTMPLKQRRKTRANNRHPSNH